MQPRERTLGFNLKPLVGKDKLSVLTGTTYKRKFISVLLKSHELGSVRQFHRVFKAAINASVEEEIIPWNRFNKITIEDDIQKVTNYTTVLLLAYTGMRRGEALRLKWTDFDPDLGTLNIERTQDEYGDSKPKTKNSYRVVPIDEVIINQLKSYKISANQ